VRAAFGTLLAKVQEIIFWESIPAIIPISSHTSSEAFPLRCVSAKGSYKGDKYAAT
jgi:hypothetical protein